MSSAVNNNNVDIKKVAPTQPVGTSPQQPPSAGLVDKFKEVFNREKGARDNQTRQKLADKKERETPTTGLSGTAIPLGMFNTPSIGDNVSGLSGTGSNPIDAALQAMADITYAGALVSRSEHVDGSLHVRVQNEQFAGVEIMVTMATSQEEKKRLGNQIHMQIWSKNVEQHAAFTGASKKLQGAKFSGCALNIDIKPVS